MIYVFRITYNEESLLIGNVQIKLSSLKTVYCITKCIRYYKHLFQYFDIYIKSKHNP